VGRVPFPYLIALLCGFLVAVAVGCGADRSHLIPGQRASDLTRQLDDIKSSIDAGQCDGLSAKITRFHDDATNLPNSVDRRLRRRINDGVGSLQAHAVDDCEAAAAAKTQTQTTDTTPTETQTETVPTDTTTTTVPTDTTTTPAPPTDTTTAPTDTTTVPGDGGGTGTPTTPGATTPSDNGGTSGEGVTP
jgi:hypothetical protein